MRNLIAGLCLVAAIAGLYAMVWRDTKARDARAKPQQFSYLGLCPVYNGRVVVSARYVLMTGELSCVYGPGG